MNTPTFNLAVRIDEILEMDMGLYWQRKLILQACKDAGLRFPKIDLSGKTLLIPIDLQEAQK